MLTRKKAKGCEHRRPGASLLANKEEEEALKE